MQGSGMTNSTGAGRDKDLIYEEALQQDKNIEMNRRIGSMRTFARNANAKEKNNRRS